MEFYSSEYIVIFGKGQILESVNTTIICLFLGEVVDNCHVITEMRALIPVAFHKGWLLWFSQYLKQGCISLASKIPLKQDLIRMLRLLLRRVLSLPPVAITLRQTSAVLSVIGVLCFLSLRVLHSTFRATDLSASSCAALKITRGIVCTNSWTSLDCMLGNHATLSLCYFFIVVLHTTSTLQLNAPKIKLRKVRLKLMAE